MPAPLDRTYPLSAFQLPFFREHRRAPHSGEWNRGCSLRLDGRVDADALREAWMQILERHEGMRVVYTLRDGEPVQRVGRPDPSSFEVHALEDGTEEQLRALVASILERPFDLERGPVARGALVRGPDGNDAFVLVNPHIQADLSAVDITFRELGGFYGALTGGPAFTPPAPRSYGAFVEEQWARLRGPELERLESYWSAQLRDLPPEIGLPWDRPRSRERRQDRKELTLTLLDRDEVHAIRSLRERIGATTFRVLYSAWIALIHRYSRQRDLVVGMSVYCGGDQDHDTIGNFANVVPLRVDVDPTAPFAELARQIASRVDGAQAHRHYPIEWLATRLLPSGGDVVRPFETIHQHGRLTRSPSLTPLFLATLPVAWSGTIGPIRVTGSVPVAQHGGTLPLELLSVDVEGRLGAQLSYDAARFNASTIRHVLHHYREVLRHVVRAPETPVGELSLVDREERTRIVSSWSRGPKVPVEDLPIHALVERAVDAAPHAPAIVFEGETLSYRELDARANRLANHLRAGGLRANEPVACILRRGPRVPQTFLAVSKAGGAYVPIDATYPAARIRAIFEDASPSVVIAEAATRSLLALAPPGVQQLDLDSPDVTAALDHVSGARPVRVNDGRSIAYFIFTSGTTGRPKGVMIEHRGVANYAADVRARWELDASSRVLAFASFSFDSSVADLYGTLTAGGALVIRPERILGGAELATLMTRERVTHAQIPPAVVTTLPEGFAPEDLRVLVSSGDVCPPTLTAAWAGRTKMINEYGPTEITVCATSHTCIAGELPPIGTPIANVDAFVIEPSGGIAAVGVPGELHLTGVGLALGYASQPSLTSERFVAIDVDGRRELVYRTGDLVRWDGDGRLRFLGRVDDQVKIRGHRVELGEVFAALRAVEGVRDATVSIREDDAGRRSLAAYVVLADGIDTKALRDAVRRSLPGYMVPSTFTAIDRIPLDTHGKVDRTALPAPRLELEPSAPPSLVGDLVAGVSALFAELLDASRIDPDESFFDAGGNSLLAVELATLIKERLGSEIGVAAIFEAGTPRKIAALLSPHEDAASRPSAEDKTTLVFCSPTDANDEVYRVLAGALAEDVNAVQVTLAPTEPLAVGLRETANELGQRLGARPYFLVGWSSGGWVALRLARELEITAIARAMRGVILLDTHSMEAAGRAEPFAAVAPSLGRMASIVAQLPPSERDAFVRELHPLDAAERIERTLALAKRRGFTVPFASREEALREAMGSEARRREIEVGEIASHVPIHYVRASSSTSEESEPFFAAPHVTRHIVDADHFSIFTSPRTVDLVRAIALAPDDEAMARA